MIADRSLLRNKVRVAKSEAEKMYRAFFAMDALYGLYDTAREEVEGATKGPICVDACGKCCESMTPIVSRIEALYILSAASFLPSYTNIKQRAERWLTDQQVETHDDPAAFEQDFAALSHAGCPFLGDDKTCTIYELRPIQCRAYGVTRPADPFCVRPLHYTESDDDRMIVTSDTPLGGKIRRVVQSVIAIVKDWKPELVQVGLLPSLLAKELIPQDKLNVMPIAPAKRLRREAKTSPLWAEEFKQQVTKEIEENPNDD